MSSQSGMRHLEEALEAWMEFRAGLETGSVEEFLARHEHLRDLLEPMVRGAEGEAGEEASSVELVGRVFDDFRLVREIGRGGMGIVFEARQLSLDRKVAIKILSAHAALSTTSIVRFKREALTSARLRHQGIVDVHAVGETDGLHWFAMELIEGESLEAVAQRLRVERPERFVRDIVTLIARVADALEHAHRAGVVHRDIKPSNILVRAEGPVLTDFGLAREQGLPSVSHDGEFKGTPYYVSPEQAHHRSSGVDQRTDVFSLGVTLFELLTQTRPFDGETTHSVLQTILSREPRDPRTLNPKLTGDLAAVILKALEKDPDGRYPSAAAFAEDLRNLLAFRPVNARHANRLQRLQRWVRREPIRAGLYVTLAIALPIVITLSIYVLGTQRATSVGRSAIAIQRVEELLLDAAMARYSPNPDRREALVRQALDLAPDDPHVRAEIALDYIGLGTDESFQRALELIDERAELMDAEPGLERVRCKALRALGRDGEAQRLAAKFGEPTTALEHYLRAVDAMSDCERGVPGACTRAKEAAQRAALISERPRSVFFIMLKTGANATGDKATEISAAEALVWFWPGSAGAWIHVALAHKDTDVERAEQAVLSSFESAPDNFVGLTLLIEFARRRGDIATANELTDRARELHPRFRSTLEIKPPAPNPEPTAADKAGDN